MKFIPILFSTPMVQAILDGSKTQTRRTIKPQPDLAKHTHIKKAVILDGSNNEVFNYCTGNATAVESVKCPYGQPGDVLWVRETFMYSDDLDEPYWFRATFEEEYNKEYLERIKGNWKPSIFMPKEACRIFLKVKSVRPERLQDINRGDAMAEGCPFPNMAKGISPVVWFTALWESINGEHSWNENPWVWVIEFEKIDLPADFC